MRIYRIATGAHLENLGDPIREVPILNIPLCKYQEEACRDAGVELVDVPSKETIEDGAAHLFFYDDLFFTKGYLAEFMEGAKTLGGNAVASLPPTKQWKALGALQDEVTIGESEVRYNRLRYVVPGDASAPVPVVVDTESGFLWKMKWLPHVLPGYTATYHPVGDRFVIQIVIPLHLGIANIFARFDRIAQAYRTPAPQKFWGGVEAIAERFGRKSALDEWVIRRRRWRADRGLPRVMYRLLRHSNKIGKNCDIHPTAWLEMCDVGDNVRIGAFSYLQQATLGDNVDVGEYCHIRISSIGENTMIPQIARIGACVVYPGAFIAARAVNFGMVGRDAQIYFSLYSDHRVDHSPITVMFRGKIVEAKVPYLGVTVGHRAVVAGSLVTAPGRFVPNGVTLLPTSDNVFVKAPKGVKEGDVIRLGKDV